MKITLAMLLYCTLSAEIAENEGMNARCVYAVTGSLQQDTKSIKLLSGRMPLQSDTLYVLDSADADVLTAVHTDRSSVVQAVICRRTGEHAEEFPFPGFSFPKPWNMVVLETVLTPSEVLEVLFQMRQRLMEWDAAFMEGIIKRQPAAELFGMGYGFLRRAYAIVDVDMRVLYYTEGYEINRHISNGFLDNEAFQELVTHRAFHEAAEEQSGFYFTSRFDVPTYCRNICVNGHFLARVVMILREDESQLPAGVCDFFEQFASRIENAFSQINLMPLNHASDNLHRLMSAMIEGETVEEALVGPTLKAHGWSRGGSFITAVIHFSEAPGWNAQLISMLPYMTSQLESLWPGSCAVQKEGEIILTVDCDREKMTRGQADADERKNAAKGQKKRAARPSFLQTLAYYLRENICKAGISPVFHDLKQLPSAVKAAVVSLQLGEAMNPDFWYYRYDDYRLMHLVSEMGRLISPDMLMHPALHILKKYDQEHSAALLETLHTFLLCNLNMTTAAQKLFIHRTSFCRRMNQIRALTGLDLSDPDTILMLLVSYRVMNETGNCLHE